MNETLLWFLYCVSGAVAFALIYRWGSRIVTAMLGGAAVTLAGWTLLYALADEETRPDFWKLDLTLNASFGLIFAAAGAALAHVALSRRRAR